MQIDKEPTPQAAGGRNHFEHTTASYDNNARHKSMTHTQPTKSAVSKIGLPPGSTSETLHNYPPLPVGQDGIMLDYLQVGKPRVGTNDNSPFGHNVKYQKKILLENAIGNA